MKTHWRPILSHGALFTPAALVVPYGAILANGFKRVRPQREFVRLRGIAKLRDGRLLQKATLLTDCVEKVLSSVRTDFLRAADALGVSVQ
jgi:hypothetical protein